jgi:hypothetical protein
VAHAWVIYPGADEAGEESVGTGGNDTNAAAGGGNDLYVALTPAAIPRRADGRR